MSAAKVIVTILKPDRLEVSKAIKDLFGIPIAHQYLLDRTLIDSVEEARGERDILFWREIGVHDPFFDEEFDEPDPIIDTGILQDRLLQPKQHPKVLRVYYQLGGVPYNL